MSPLQVQLVFAGIAGMSMTRGHGRSLAGPRLPSALQGMSFGYRPHAGQGGCFAIQSIVALPENLASPVGCAATTLDRVSTSADAGTQLDRGLG